MPVTTATDAGGAVSGDRSANRSNSAYTDRSDSGISNCSHSSLLDSFSKPWLIHEEDESGGGCGGDGDKLMHFTIHCAGGAAMAEKGRSVVSSRHSTDSALEEAFL